MGRIGRIATCAVTAVSVATIFGLLALRMFAQNGTAVAMVPLGGDQAVMLSANWGAYCEITYVERWPGPRWGAWAGPGWQDVGPFLSWWRYRQDVHYKFAYREGVAMVPLAKPGEPVEYENSYKRAEALGFPRTLARPPFTAVVNAWQVQFPLALVIFVATIIPIGRILIAWRSRRRHQKRREAGLCPWCGYDLRASQGACPECGRAERGRTK